MNEFALTMEMDTSDAAATSSSVASCSAEALAAIVQHGIAGALPQRARRRRRAAAPAAALVPTGSREPPPASCGRARQDETHLESRPTKVVRLAPAPSAATIEIKPLEQLLREKREAKEAAAAAAAKRQRSDVT